MRRFVLFLPVFLVGCRPHGLGAIVGDWRSTIGSDFKFDGTSNFRTVVHRNGRDTVETGTVAFADDRYTLTIASVNGRSIADVKAGLERRSAGLTPRLQAITAMLGKPETFLLSPDGKTLTKEEAKIPYSLVKVGP